MPRRTRGEDSAFTSAQIVSQLSGMLDTMSASFVKADAAAKLGLVSDRELALLTDALHVMAKSGLIEWVREGSSWKNNAR